MKTRTKISYIILKYDDQTDNIFTKTLNNENHVYEVPNYDYVQKRDGNLTDVKDYILEKAIDINDNIDENHIFIPFLNVSYTKRMTTYNYVAVIFESNKTIFSSMNYESWHRIKYNRDAHQWLLTWDGGLSDPVDFKFPNPVVSDYVSNFGDEDEINFANVMHFVSQKTQEFPILGLMSGDQFTMKQVFHYQDLLGIETLKAGDNSTFENQYSDSIQAIQDDRMTTSYKIKNEYLKKW